MKDRTLVCQAANNSQADYRMVAYAQKCVARLWHGTVRVLPYALAAMPLSLCRAHEAGVKPAHLFTLGLMLLHEQGDRAQPRLSLSQQSWRTERPRRASPPRTAGKTKSAQSVADNSCIDEMAARGALYVPR